MALGFIPASGDWDYRQFNTNSAATFVKGCLVTLNGARDVIEYQSTDSSYLGIALHNSANSCPAGKVLVAIPKPGCTAFCDAFTGMATSVTSVGQAMGIAKSGNFVSFITTLHTSVWSQTVTIVNQPRSADSRVEVAFIFGDKTELYSASSVSLV